MNDYEPLFWTTARWCNRQDEEGHWSKVLAHRGSYIQFAYGTDTPSWWNRPDLQWAIICSPQSGVIALDVDRPADFPGSHTSGYVTIADASTTRWDPKLDQHRFHILVDMRAIPRWQWPGQSWTAWGDVKANGFVPWPGGWHYSGIQYEPARSTGLPYAIPATPALVAAINADIANRPPREGHGGGGGVSGQADHDTERMKVVMNTLLDGCDEEECYKRWAAAPDHDATCSSSSGFTDKDYDRHYASASRYAAEIQAREERDKLWAEQLLANLRRRTR